MLQIISEPYRIEQFDITVTASIGIAIYPDDGADMEALFRNADTAMYQAKREGRARYRFFTTEMQSSVLFQMKLINALRTALVLNQFQIHYQPQISYMTGASLVRKPCCAGHIRIWVTYRLLYSFRPRKIPG